jgi:hypothetical protein
MTKQKSISRAQLLYLLPKLMENLPPQITKDDVGVLTLRMLSIIDRFAQLQRQETRRRSRGKKVRA